MLVRSGFLSTVVLRMQVFWGVTHVGWVVSSVLKDHGVLTSYEDEDSIFFFFFQNLGNHSLDNTDIPQDLSCSVLLTFALFLHFGSSLALLYLSS